MIDVLFAGGARMLGMKEMRYKLWWNGKFSSCGSYGEGGAV